MNANYQIKMAFVIHLHYACAHSHRDALWLSLVGATAVFTIDIFIKRKGIKYLLNNLLIVVQITLMI